MKEVKAQPFRVPNLKNKQATPAKYPQKTNLPKFTTMRRTGRGR